MPPNFNRLYSIGILLTCVLASVLTIPTATAAAKQQSAADKVAKPVDKATDKPTNNEQATSTAATETVIDGLNHPAGVAVHPGTQQVYVSDSGNGRIIRINQGQAVDVVTGFPTSILAEDFGFQAGPLGLHFMPDESLLVAEGGRDSATDRVSIFQLGDTPTTSDQPKTAYSIKPSSDAPLEGDFFSLAHTNGITYVIGRGDEKFGWVNRLSSPKDTPKRNSDSEPEMDLKRFIDTWAGVEEKRPTAIAISPQGFVAVGFKGENDDRSVLGFFDQADGQLRAKFTLHQEGIIAVAYGPNAQRLYALFHSDEPAAKNGLYKLVGRNRNTECECQLIVELENPRAMAFDTSGHLFVAAGNEDGKLLKISDLDPPAAAESTESKSSSDASR